MDYGRLFARRRTSKRAPSSQAKPNLTPQFDFTIWRFAKHHSGITGRAKCANVQHVNFIGVFARFGRFFRTCRIRSSPTVGRLVTEDETTRMQHGGGSPAARRRRGCGTAAARLRRGGGSAAARRRVGCGTAAGRLRHGGVSVRQSVRHVEAPQARAVSAGDSSFRTLQCIHIEARASFASCRRRVPGRSTFGSAMTNGIASRG